MWGCIAGDLPEIAAEMVPSLYVRVYRIKVFFIPVNGSSLIICEGVSREEEGRRLAEAFPHYMWGYIGRCPFTHTKIGVPSLYVRVYRADAVINYFTHSSLIICEGISKSLHGLAITHEFPHYMWGYINTRPRQCGAILGSLIICEGISINHPKTHLIEGFPHYMWGYIKPGRLFVCSRTVPSLYVRVYRVQPTARSSRFGSLIICEGISGDRLRSFIADPFPHYTWGYIEIGNGILQASKNINVVDDSIPQIA